MLTRVLGFDRDLAVVGNERLLWGQAQELLPAENLDVAMPRYTQGLMDLGASLCTPRAPQCGHCPLADCCAALQDGNPETYPVRTRKLSRRAESWQLLVLHNGAGDVWLQRRPPRGIWAGLHCPPTFADRVALDACVEAWSGLAPVAVRELQPFVHVLTHRDLHLHPVLVTGAGIRPQDDTGEWMGAARWPGVGLPAPVRKLLEATQPQLW